MDATNGLIVELQAKLEELDHKVAAYRHDMAAEYVKHSDLLLQEFPDDVSKSVRSAVHRSFASYSFLFPANLECLLSCGAEESRVTANLVETDETTLPTTSFLEKQQANIQSRSHEREAELAGLFTPSYLPLLDSNPRDERRSSSEVMASPRTISNGKRSLPIETLSLGLVAPPSASSSYTPDSPLSKPPTPRRRNTEDFSGSSSQNSLPKRRSAMRRTSSSGKAHSPRRVRFDFEGELFTTTQSPRPPTPILIAAETNASAVGLLSDSGDEAVAEQVEDVNEQPAPRRVSSTQALQALSRQREEEVGVQWTQVSAPFDGSASIEEEPTDSDEDDFLDMSSKPSLGHKNDTSSATSLGEPDTLPVPDNVYSHDRDMSRDLVGVDVLAPWHTSAALTLLRPMPSSSDARVLVSDTTASIPPSSTGDYEAFSQSPRAKDWLLTPITHKGRAPAVDFNLAPLDISEGEEELFEFDETPQNDGVSRQRNAPALALNNRDEDEEEEEEEEDAEGNADSGNEEEADPSGARPETSGSGAFQAKPSLYATSPARVIARSDVRSTDLMGSLPRTGKIQMLAGKPASSTPGHQRSSTELQGKTTISSPIVTGSTSSRLIHPWNMPVVNSSAHAQAAQMGDVRSFVGSLNGKSGPDESQANLPAAIGPGSFRAGSLGGKPRSLSERMMMDDFMAAGEGED